MKDVVRIQVYCNTGFVNCKHNFVHEVDKAEWEALSEKEKEVYLDELATDNVWNHIDAGAYVLDEDEQEGED